MVRDTKTSLVPQTTLVPNGHCYGAEVGKFDFRSPLPARFQAGCSSLRPVSAAYCCACIVDKTSNKRTFVPSD